MGQYSFKNVSFTGLQSDRDGFRFCLGFEQESGGPKYFDVFISGTNAQLLSQKLCQLDYIDAIRDPEKWKRFMGALAAEALFELGMRAKQEEISLSSYEAVGKITQPSSVTWEYSSGTNVVRIIPSNLKSIKIILDDGSELEIQLIK